MSAIASNTVTISGPPPVLRRLLTTSPALSTDWCQWLPVYAPYHAAQLYGFLDINTLLGSDDTSARKLLTEHRPKATMLSAVDGRPLGVTDLLGMLEQVASDILLAPLRWDRILASCIGEIGKENSSECVVRPVGPCKATNSLVAALRTGTRSNTSVDHSFTFNCFQSSMSEPQSEPRPNNYYPPIAVVGMAGKFPGANSPDDLWKSLEQGLDMHRKVIYPVRFARS